ncbi:gas vesicle protein GvpU [Bacillus sp. LL01]|uniref:gas vesicle accessory protein GvpU n=1 Tax=Bacillus sp. LL01 TaxID=1665556 RepID=UPI00064D2216|nr:gas vesicle accessory protein GvpU [Bacillus sp. LL01]KMJ56159.1 gas vesicle protein GvpU [Bacillus sp. LL01]
MSDEVSARKDSILQFFVQAANKHSFSLDITLNVKGSLISGTLVSAKEYLDELNESFEGGNEVAQKVSNELSKASEEAESGSPPEVSFIHMKHTKVFIGDSKSTPSTGKIIWRGKLSEVDGFFLGKITDSSE